MVMVMVHQEKLAFVLGEFARTLATEFPIQAILDHLVDRIVEILPITAAGVTLISDGVAPHYISASDDSALRFEKLQTEIGEGPCVAAFESGEAVSVPDITKERRFPVFGPAAMAAGMGAVFTFPLREGEGRLGALDLYRDRAGDIGDDDMAAAQTLADVATAYLLNARAREVARTTSDAFRHSALHDALTSLPNRVLLQQRLDHALLRVERSKRYVAVLFTDLDRFKLINDTYGHHVGDQLLIAVARRLAGLVRPGDTLARFSGDEFVFLCEDLRSAADVETLAARVEAALEQPFVLGRLELSVTASVGISSAGAGAASSDALLADADVAMYQAKRKGGASHQVIDLTESAERSDGNNIEFDLQVALAEQNLTVAYQPIVRCADGVTTGVEALLRWAHPTRGPVPAVTMVAIAERSGLIVKLGAWVLERGCEDHARWAATNPGRSLDLAVNVSARELVSRDYADGVAATIARTGMDPHALVLEVTENIIVDDGERSIEVLSDLKALGIRIAMDDFGTGYSSLSYLRRLPIDIVKIDQGFIADIGQPAVGGTIVAAVTNLAHALGLTVVAEGVETSHQHEEVKRMGCDQAQGFFYAAPTNVADMARYLDAPTPTAP
jgi:diguanylate cyclase (GGDEF)-like protein